MLTSTKLRLASISTAFALVAVGALLLLTGQQSRAGAAVQPTVASLLSVFNAAPVAADQRPAGGSAWTGTPTGPPIPRVDDASVRRVAVSAVGTHLAHDPAPLAEWAGAGVDPLTNQPVVCSILVGGGGCASLVGLQRTHVAFGVQDGGGVGTAPGVRPGEHVVYGVAIDGISSVTLAFTDGTNVTAPVSRNGFLFDVTSGTPAKVSWTAPTGQRESHSVYVPPPGA